VDLELTDEQRMLSASVETLLERGGEDSEVWAKLVEFGGLMVDPEALGAVELCLIARNLGAHLASVPYLGSAAARYAVAGIDDPPAAFSALSEDSTAVAVAIQEAGSGWSSASLSTRLDGGRLEGEKCAVEHAGAGALLVLAGDDSGLAVALLGPDDSGVEISPQDSIDASAPLSRLSLTSVEVGEENLLTAAAAARAAGRLTAIGALLVAAEANGAAGVMLEQATEYAGQRRQFGRSIGSNQALRHILADMYVRQSASWSSILYTAAALDGEAEEAVRSVSITKAFASRSSRDVAHGAMQVFGGIAFTEEHDAHRYLRRINLRCAQFGDAEYHERVLGRDLAARALGPTATA
jgi:alkylation response protein AidB-like acyl-CoA dehydrogenase